MEFLRRRREFIVGSVRIDRLDPWLGTTGRDQWLCRRGDLVSQRREEPDGRSQASFDRNEGESAHEEARSVAMYGVEPALVEKPPFSYASGDQRLCWVRDDAVCPATLNWLRTSPPGPRGMCFRSASSPLYHPTRWPVLGTILKCSESRRERP
jgi:hypothetical protein